MKRALIYTFFCIFITAAAAATSSAQSSVAGEWDAAMNTPGGTTSFKLIFKVDGDKLSGTVKRSRGDVPLTGTVKGSDITFSYIINYNDHDLEMSFAGKVSGDTINGVVSFGGNAEDNWSAKRVPPAKPGK